MTKSEYRKIYKNIRKNIPNDILVEKSNAVFNLLMKNERFINADTVFVYISYNNEVMTDRVIEYLHRNNKRVLIPWCNTKNETMQAVVYNKDADFKENIYGIKEIKNPEIYKGIIDLTIVPGIAFDRYGNRIGYGKGYYDKFFEDSICYKIGLSYSDTITEDMIPHSADDAIMDCVISDREVLYF